MLGLDPYIAAGNWFSTPNWKMFFVPLNFQAQNTESVSVCVCECVPTQTDWDDRENFYQSSL